MGKFGWYDCRYEDDQDEGEWFLYTGSGGRDLSGNKRVSKVSRLCSPSLAHLCFAASCLPDSKILTDPVLTCVWSRTGTAHGFCCLCRHEGSRSAVKQDPMSFAHTSKSSCLCC